MLHREVFGCSLARGDDVVRRKRASMKFGLRHKLLAGVQVYLVLLACVGLMGLHAAQVSVDRLHVAAEHQLREVTLVSDLASQVGVSHAATLLHVLSDSAEERAGYEGP